MQLARGGGCGHAVRLPCAPVRLPRTPVRLPRTPVRLPRTMYPNTYPTCTSVRLSCTYLARPVAMTLHNSPQISHPHNHIHHCCLHLSLPSSFQQLADCSPVCVCVCVCVLSITTAGVMGSHTHMINTSMH